MYINILYFANILLDRTLLLFPKVRHLSFVPLFIHHYSWASNFAVIVIPQIHYDIFVCKRLVYQNKFRCKVSNFDKENISIRGSNNQTGLRKLS